MGLNHDLGRGHAVRLRAAPADEDVLLASLGAMAAGEPRKLSPVCLNRAPERARLLIHWHPTETCEKCLDFVDFWTLGRCDLFFWGSFISLQKKLTEEKHPIHHQFVSGVMNTYTYYPAVPSSFFLNGSDRFVVGQVLSVGMLLASVVSGDFRQILHMLPLCGLLLLSALRSSLIH